MPARVSIAHVLSQHVGVAGVLHYYSYAAHSNGHTPLLHAAAVLSGCRHKVATLGMHLTSALTIVQSLYQAMSGERVDSAPTASGSDRRECRMDAVSSDRKC